VPQVITTGLSTATEWTSPTCLTTDGRRECRWITGTLGGTFGGWTPGDNPSLSTLTDSQGLQRHGLIRPVEALPFVADPTPGVAISAAGLHPTATFPIVAISAAGLRLGAVSLLVSALPFVEDPLTVVEDVAKFDNVNSSHQVKKISYLIARNVDYCVGYTGHRRQRVKKFKYLVTRNFIVRTAQKYRY
jgi:hypothetical protein